MAQSDKMEGIGKGFFSKLLIAALTQTVSHFQFFHIFSDIFIFNHTSHNQITHIIAHQFDHVHIQGFTWLNMVSYIEAITIFFCCHLKQMCLPNLYFF